MHYLTYRKEAELFGGIIEIELSTVDRFLAEEIIDEVLTEGRRLQKKFNFFDPESELSHLNKEKKKTVSEELLTVIQQGVMLSKETDGRYDIALGEKFLERKTGKKNTIRCSYKDIHIKKNEISLTNNAYIDLGSIAKGYIADKMIEIMKKHGVKEGLIDARGDIIVIGNKKIAIQHPRKEEEIIKTINITDSAIATSGDYNQYIDSFESSHIVNKTAISVTVISKQLVDADKFATALMVVSKEKREQLIKKYRLTAIIINKNRSIEEYRKGKQRKESK